MKYERISKATFLSRPNRFIAECELNGEKVVVHVRNTGRCRELLIPGATVYLDEPTGRMRKTWFDLVAVEKLCYDGTIRLINMDSQAPNEAAYEFLKKGGLFDSDVVRREVTVGRSRFDFLIEKNCNITYLEVKGVTLENCDIASFPDAPTERGIKHIDELIELKKQGYGAAILFVVQMKGISEFRPNYSTHRAFGEALCRAKKAGVEIFAYDCIITPDSMTVDNPVKIALEERL